MIHLAVKGTGRLTALLGNKGLKPLAQFKSFGNRGGKTCADGSMREYFSGHR